MIAGAMRSFFLVSEENAIIWNITRIRVVNNKKEDKSNNSVHPNKLSWVEAKHLPKYDIFIVTQINDGWTCKDQAWDNQNMEKQIDIRRKGAYEGIRARFTEKGNLYCLAN